MMKKEKLNRTAKHSKGTSLDEAVEEAEAMGFSNLFVFRGRKIRCLPAQKDYDLADIAIVDLREVAISKTVKGILCYTVSCDGRLGVVVGRRKSKKFTEVLGKIALK